MELFYRTYGNGKPLIIIHGLFGMSDNWINLAKRLSKEYRIIIPDLRNHGNSPHSSDFNLDVLTADIFDLFKSFDLQNAFFLGHSLGGRVAISFALQYPEKVEKLIIVDIAPKAYSGNKNISNLLLIMNRFTTTQLKTFSEAEQFLKQYIHEKKVLYLLLKNLKKNNEDFLQWKLNLEAISQNIETLMQPIFENTQYIKPSLFLKGETSEFVLPTDDEIILRYFPKAIIRTVKNAGHWLHAEQPDVFLQEVKNFLSD